MTCVSVGNPHCVRFVDVLQPEVLRSLGPQLETHPIFPKRTNVQLARVRSRSEIEILIWERGAGRDAARRAARAARSPRRRTGSGAVDGKVTVHMPGGALRIEIGADYALRMTGPATPVYRGALL